MNRVNVHLIGTFTQQDTDRLREAIRATGLTYVGFHFDQIEQKHIMMFDDYRDKDEEE